MASGRPVIAYARGGAKESIVDGETGVLFGEQSVEGINAAIARCDSLAFDPRVLVARAEAFSEERFAARMKAFIDEKLAAHDANVFSGRGA